MGISDRFRVTPPKDKLFSFEVLILWNVSKLESIAVPNPTVIKKTINLFNCIWNSTKKKKKKKNEISPYHKI